MQYCDEGGKHDLTAWTNFCSIAWMIIIGKRCAQAPPRAGSGVKTKHGIKRSHDDVTDDGHDDWARWLFKHFVSCFLVTLRVEAWDGKSANFKNLASHVWNYER